MKLADIDVDELAHALGIERNGWINLAKDEKREHTDAERVTVCILAALEHALKAVASGEAFRNGRASSTSGRDGGT
jgi:hypothetical protein